MKQIFTISLMSCRGNLIHECKSSSELLADKPISTARMLALAHYVEREVEAGNIRNYAEAARILGITRGRMSQVMALRFLSPRIQQAILCGNETPSEFKLREVTCQPLWNDQNRELNDSYN